jgi:hypothetical protein
MAKSFFVRCQNDEYILFDGLMKTQSFRFDGDGREHILSSFPIGGKKLPQTAKILTDKPEFLGALKVTKWSDDDFELSFDKVEVECYQAPEIIVQKQMSDRGLLHTATLYCDTRQRLMIENQFTSATFDMLSEMTNPKIEMSPLSFGLLIAVLGDAGAKKHLTIILAENNYRQVFQGIADEINFYDGGFVTKTALSDMLGRVIEESYTFRDDTRAYELTKRAFSYRNDRKYIPALTQYLFLEAVQCEDFERAQTYLCADLDAKEIADYLGQFESIESPRRSDAREPTAAILVKNDNVLVAKELRFEMKGGKIANVSDEN